jgi:hypothetical protein
MSIRDTRLIAKALEQRWPIKSEYRLALVKRLVHIIADPNSKAREVTAACRALIAAENQNLADEQHSDRMDEGRNRVLDFVARIDAAEVYRITESAGTDSAQGGNESKD